MMLKVLQHCSWAMHVKTFLTSVALFVILSWSWQSSNTLLGQTTYTPVEVLDGGTISGTVKLSNTSSKIDQMEISQDPKACGKQKRSPRLVVGSRNGIQNTIIYITGITKGKIFLNNKPTLLAQQNCEYTPHVIIVPIGKKLDIINEDPVLHNIHSYETAKEFKTVFNIAQPIKGVKSTTKPLTNPGLLTITCDAGHPWMSAYIMVAEHPYYTISDKNGNFSLDNIPPGTYTLHMWHEGIAIVKKELEHGKVQKYEFEQPYEQIQRVNISPHTTTTADFTLTLR